LGRDVIDRRLDEVYDPRADKGGTGYIFIDEMTLVSSTIPHKVLSYLPSACSYYRAYKK
jgi:hypothetical protein